MNASAVATQTQATEICCPLCGHAIVDDGRVLVDREGGFIVAGSQFASLTRLEAELFLILWDGGPRTLSKESLIDAIYWQGSIDEEPEIKIIDVLVCKIRKKLRGLPVSIETVWGRGYRINQRHMGDHR